MTRRTSKGREIAAATQVLAAQLSTARASYWRAILAHVGRSGGPGPRFAVAIAEAIRNDVDTAGLGPALSEISTLATRSVVTRRRGDRESYQRVVEVLASELAQRDRGCEVLNACMDTIRTWSERGFASPHPWRGRRIQPARTKSLVWTDYWRALESARAARERMRDQIVVRNEGLVVRFVRRREPWQVGHLQRDDLLQLGREGLARAADLYQHDRDPPIAFSTYAMHWIRHHVDRGHANTARTIRLPIGIQALSWRISKLIDDGDRPDPEHLARALGSTERKVRYALEAMKCREVSLDMPVSPVSGRSMTIAELIPDDGPGADQAIDQGRISASLVAALDRLDPEAKRVVESRYGFSGEPLSAGKLARLGVLSIKKIRAIESDALGSLREFLGPEAWSADGMG